MFQLINFDSRYDRTLVNATLFNVNCLFQRYKYRILLPSNEWIKISVSSWKQSTHPPVYLSLSLRNKGIKALFLRAFRGVTANPSQIPDEPETGRKFMAGWNGFTRTKTQTNDFGWNSREQLGLEGGSVANKGLLIISSATIHVRGQIEWQFNRRTRKDCVLDREDNREKCFPFHCHLRFSSCLSIIFLKSYAFPFLIFFIAEMRGIVAVYFL